jgi:hypothetical protein
MAIIGAIPSGPFIDGGDISTAWRMFLVALFRRPALASPVTITAPSWTHGTGAPTATQPLGSLYSRDDGGVGSTLYVSRGSGTWNAVAGV